MKKKKTAKGKAAGSPVVPKPIVDVAKALKKARVKAGKTQFEVAIAANIRPESLSRIENGMRASPATLERLAPVLSLNIRELLLAR